jgi:N-acetylmuramoyl-L-alanine amidase
MRIACDWGHGTGQDRGAEGYLNEEKVIREYGPLVIEGLQNLGHTVINVTPTQAGLTLNQSLAYRVNCRLVV